MPVPFLRLADPSRIVRAMSGQSPHSSRDPLHGVTLQTIVSELSERHGWAEMGRRIPVRCFLHDPSVKSSLTFLRKTPWARRKVEKWFAEEADRHGEAARLPDGIDKQI